MHRRSVAKLGEENWHNPNGKRDPGVKAEPNALECAFLGIRNKSTEAIIGTKDGVSTARTIRKLSADERLNKQTALSLKYSVAANLNNGQEPGGV